MADGDHRGQDAVNGHMGVWALGHLIDDGMHVVMLAPLDIVLDFSAKEALMKSMQAPRIWLIATTFAALFAWLSGPAFASLAAAGVGDEAASSGVYALPGFASASKAHGANACPDDDHFCCPSACIPFVIDTTASETPALAGAYKASHLAAPVDAPLRPDHGPPRSAN